MAIFSGKVVSATFMDFPTNTLIEVLYQEENGLVPYVLEVDFTSSDFNDLLQDITLEEIETATRAIVKAEANTFNQMINSEIDRRWALESEKIKEAYGKVDQDREEALKALQENYNSASSTYLITPKDLLNKVESLNIDTDFLFNMKIAILEDPIISKSKDKELKLSIRKAKSVFELLSIYSARKLDQKD
jgi:hypothetical protein